MIGMVVGLIVTTWLGSHFFSESPDWIKFLASLGAVLLTFLAGAKLDPDVFKKNWKEAGAFVEQAHTHYTNQFSHLQKKTHKYTFPIHFKSVIGHSTEKILRHAEELKIDHIIVGSRGKGFFQRILLRSVSKQVVIYAHCSVIVVR